MEKEYTNHCKEDGNIVLIGFMGVGKSAVAHCLGTMLKKQVIDMDQVIANREGMCISDIFVTQGETYFRERETRLLVEFLKIKNTIVSSGGGAVLAKENVCYMKKYGLVVLLTASPQTVYGRIKDCGDRPVLENKNSVEHIAYLMEKRRKKYEKAADLVIDTEHKTLEQVCQELMRKWMEMNKNNV